MTLKILLGALLLLLAVACLVRWIYVRIDRALGGLDGNWGLAGFPPDHSDHRDPRP